MVVIIKICIDCGNEFPKGIWHQSTCARCSMKKPIKVYSLKKGIMELIIDERRRNS